MSEYSGNVKHLRGKKIKAGDFLFSSLDCFSVQHSIEIASFYDNFLKNFHCYLSRKREKSFMLWLLIFRLTLAKRKKWKKKFLFWALAKRRHQFGGRRQTNLGIMCTTNDLSSQHKSEKRTWKGKPPWTCGGAIGLVNWSYYPRHAFQWLGLTAGPNILKTGFQNWCHKPFNDSVQQQDQIFLKTGFKNWCH